MTKRRWGRYLALGLVLLAALYLWTRPVCWRSWVFQGIEAESCPDGQFRQTVAANLYAVQRGKEAQLSVSAMAHYLEEGSSSDRLAPIRRLTAQVSLVDAAGKEQPLETLEPWKQGHGGVSARLKFPSVPDGDYKVRVRAETSLGKAEVEVPLALYAPAKVHVLTDRPLYQAGDLIKFRAVALRARDLSPLDGRPGRWEIRDPSGELVLEERAPAGSWGVVAGSFPLDQGAPTGPWRIAWVSGAARDEVTVTVQPFVLPRFRVEVAAEKPYYQAHQKPEVKGRVVYSSGAPVANAKLELHWSVSGDWPPPTNWVDDLLPAQATADKDGAFDLKLPEIPGDLIGRSSLSAFLTATDASGDRVNGSVNVLLTADAIQVSPVTELEDGLVEGFNNRLFLRASTADGQVLPGAELRVQRAWDPDDPGTVTTADEDGVAQLQIDPGPAVNVVIPPPPYRPPPPQPAVSLTASRDLLDGEDELPLAVQSALEKIVPRLAGCARFASGEGEATVALEVDASGAVRAHGQRADALSTCAADELKSQRLPGGKARLMQLELQFSDHALPQLSVELDGTPAVPEPLRDAVTSAVLNARTCLPRSLNGTAVQRATWHLGANQKTAALSWLPETGEARAFQSCLQSKVASVALKDASAQDVVGTVHLTVSRSSEEEQSRPEATTMLGYELKVTAKKAGKELGHTTLRLRPGQVPSLRLRATPVLAEAGGNVQIEVLRGPSYQGELPKKAWLNGANLEKPLLADIDEEQHTAAFQLPANAAGWYLVETGSAKTMIYVRSQAELSVALRTDKERYAPGQTAKLAVLTRVAGQGAPAAVGLFGVDESLGQLTALPGPEDMARLREKASMTSPAFGSLDAEALVLGRIRGANAAMATVQRVTALPTAAQLDGVFQGSAQSTFDPNAELTDRFYGVLGELHAQAREWEEKAPKNEKMRLPRMAKLWEQALAAVKARGGRIDDAYGRPLRLSQLPPDLLALTDPRQVVIQGTRLPEDVENWAAYVAKEKP